MKLLIVNADDFGYTSGVNQGILIAHTKGIVTSTSLMVDGHAVDEAVELAKSLPDLDVGLHFQLSTEGLRSILKAHLFLHFSSKDKVLGELENQVEKFEKLMSRTPTHIDSHHHLHLYSKLKPIFEEFSETHGLGVRGLRGNKLVTSFYGRNQLRRVDLDRIRPKSLASIISHLDDGVNELMCHPGIVDAQLVAATSYASERELELTTLISPEIKSLIKENGIQSVSWTEAGRLVGS